MKMCDMTDWGLVVFAVLLTSVIDVDARLTLSQNTLTKVLSDDTFQVTCRDEDGLPVTWRKPRGTILGPKTRPKVEEKSFGSMLIFNNPHRVEDTGNYTCSTSKDKQVFELFMLHPLQFKDTPTNQTTVEGKEEFVLKCEVIGGSITWTQETGEVITQSNKFNPIGDGLCIRNVTRHDSKTYICKAVQPKSGGILDRKIHLHVKHKPVHPNPLQKHMRHDIVYGYINGTVNLTCVAVANPPATFQWRVNDKKAKIGHTINENPEVSILQIHIDNKSAFGNFKCIARNEFGTYEEIFTVKEGQRPVSPTRVEMRDALPEVTIFEIVGPERATEMDLETKGFRVQYRKIDEQEWKYQEFNITKSNLYSLVDLEPNTEYEMQAATRNAAGLSDFFPVTQWKTSGATRVQITLSLYALAALFLLRNNLPFW